MSEPTQEGRGEPLPVEGREPADPELSRIRRIVADGLADVLPDVRIVDQHLEVGHGRAVDLVGLDAAGRLVLILIEPGDGDRAVLALLDALAFAERNRMVMAGHLQSTHYDAERPPLAVLVARRIPAEMIARMGALRPQCVRLLELRVLASARGERSYLVPVFPAGQKPSLLPIQDAQVFLSALAEPSRALANLLLRRIVRIDDHLECTASEGELVWHLGERLLCTVVSNGAGLVGRTPPQEAPRGFRDEEDVESFVAEVLSRYVDLLELDEEEDEPPVEVLDDPLAGSDPGMVLTPEEQEAFRELL